jgi:Ca-activated chloride channel family protein
MTFAWPWLLSSLLLLPLLVLAYRQLLRRRAARRAELAGLGLVALPSGGTAATRRWRHVAPAFFLAAFALLLVGLARPQASISQPRREGTVVLAFDISNSMLAKDVQPSRIAAAKAAAKAFVAKQPSQIRLAVVAFGSSGVISQRPTTDRAAVLAAIDRLAPQGGTALGRGLQTSLTAIAGKTVRLDSSEDNSSVEPQGDNIGYFGSSAVILLSDGENTTPPDPQDAADLASTAGVKVFPIGLGSPKGTVLKLDGFQIETKLDEPTLQAIAKTTDGEYFRASDAAELAKVYDAIPLSWVVRGRPIELTGLLAAVAGLLLLAGAGLSLARTGRVI